MHFLIRFLVVSCLANVVLGQPCQNETAHCVRISKLVLRSNRLPAADRKRIIRSLREKTYPEGEIGDQIRQAVRSLGYFKAVVDEPKFSFPTEGRDVANVSVRVNPGIQYRLGEISFRRVTVFLPEQLRSVFAPRRGDLFNATRISVGLKNLMKLYGTRGYVNTVVFPQLVTDDSRRTIDLILEVHEGQAYDLNKSYPEAAEPHPGVGKALLNSWMLSEGRCYNPVELKHGLLTNRLERKLGTLASALRDN